MGEPRVVIVGAGPAGVRAAEALVAAGLRPTVVYDHVRDGGQIYRRQPDGFSRSYETLYGTEAGHAQALHAVFDSIRSRINDRPRTLAWNVADNELHTIANGRSDRLAFDALILCTGAIDRMFPIEGWQRAGTYSLGAAQIALKSQGCAIGRRVVFAGTGPLLYLVAKQYVAAGAKVAAVLDTSPFDRRVRALPGLLARPGALWKGVALTLALKRAGVRVETGITPLEIQGDAVAGVSGFVWRARNGAQQAINCDAVGFGYHVSPETQLADLAGCAFKFDAAVRQWLPTVDEDGRSSVPRVYLAGDGAGVAGADAAELAGQLAALAALRDLGRDADPSDMSRLRQDIARQRRFARAIRAAFPWPAHFAANVADKTIVCRCEEVTAGDIRRAVGELGAREVNRTKAFCRAGMGRCQGRYCGNAAAEIVAHAANIPIEQAGRLRGQAPVKPLPMDAETSVPA